VHGFDQTTVAEIAQRAGLTERTFFRHFTDKREVLFWGQGALHDVFVSTVATAPDSVAPIDAIAAALVAVGDNFGERWLDDTNKRSLSQLIRESMDELKAATAGEPSPAAQRPRRRARHQSDRRRS
jgi:AcrR family transcriptional regulator